MKTTLASDPPVWPDWSVTARVASVAGTLARMRECLATYGCREADSSLTPAIETLRNLAVAGGDSAVALAHAADHLATARRWLEDEWWKDDARYRDRVEAASAALAAARARLESMTGSIGKTAYAAIWRADKNFALYANGGFATDIADPPAAAGTAAACAAFAHAAVELSAAGRHLASAGGDGAASASRAAKLAASLAASLAHAMSHHIGCDLMTPPRMRQRL